MATEKTTVQVLMMTLKESMVAAGHLKEVEGGGWVLTDTGRVFLEGYEARHPKLKLEELAGVVREFEALGVEAWEDVARVWVCLRLRGPTVGVVRYVRRINTVVSSKELVEDMRAELAQREAPQTA